MSEGDSRTIDQQSGGNSASKYRGKKDPAWQYCTADIGGGLKKIICDFCHVTIGGGGIHRMKEHLAGAPGNVVSCSKVPSEVRFRMKSSIKEHQDKKKEKVMSAGNGDQCDNEFQDNRNRALINFLVYSQHGVSFIKSVDISSIEANAENLCNLFAEIVEIVGPQNIVHMVTDNAPNYKNAGSLLTEKYPSIAWSPCAAHCINLIMKDMTKLPSVNDVITLASRITVFVYNHKWPLNWLRNRPGWTEIIRPGDTRFGTSFIALKSLYDHKEHLQALVISPGFKIFLRVAKAKEAKQVILDEKFWNNCLIISKIMGPIMRLLRICDSDEKPSLGYVYEGMWRVVKGVKELFKNKERLYEKYVDIIESRWDRMLKKNLHAVAFWLNPAFQYDPESPTDTSEVMAGLVNVWETLCPGVDGFMEEINTFREKRLGFGRKMALGTSKSSRPDEWWRTFGFGGGLLVLMMMEILVASTMVFVT
ncbi:uncharacterized protein LOC121765670 [Salvia splendens]|uniref:uncharacterized protein LOC121765670 n=1 Tax=Salvia splendens TaxID=180675 RepID=UPI001C2514E4|nr:uncharacterized protein LOC121765670 [Salvia splendens]